MLWWWSGRLSGFNGRYADHSEGRRQLAIDQFVATSDLVRPNIGATVAGSLT